MRRRLMLKSSTGVSPVLPAEYQQVEWIKFDTASYIDTLFSVSAGDVLECDGAFGNSSNNAAIFSVGPKNDAKGNGWAIFVQNWTNNWMAMYQYTTGYALFGTRDTNRHLFVVDSQNDTVNVDNESASVGYSTHIPSASYTVYLGRNAYASHTSAATIYRFSVINNGITKLNCIPCYRKVDNVIGLYDTISDTFLTNEGSGTITKGADV